MKYFIALFAVYLVALTLVPCDDAWKKEHEIAHQNTSHSHDQHDHNHEVENCSPFCACGCCGVQLANYTPQNFFRIVLSLRLPHIQPESLYSKNFISSYSGSIWQPPQLS